jgi:hypothetical protein
MKKPKFKVTIGYQEGYDNLPGGLPPEEKFAAMVETWKKIAADTFKLLDIYVSATATPGVVLYHNDWGCPKNGEPVVTFEGVQHIVAEHDPEEFKEVVLEIVKEMRTEFKQSTITLEFGESDLIYITNMGVEG